MGFISTVDAAYFDHQQPIAMKSITASCKFFNASGRPAVNVFSSVAGSKIAILDRPYYDLYLTGDERHYDFNDRCWPVPVVPPGHRRP